MSYRLEIVRNLADEMSATLGFSSSLVDERLPQLIAKRKPRDSGTPFQRLRSRLINLKAAQLCLLEESSGEISRSDQTYRARWLVSSSDDRKSSSI